jgi:putative membrane protein
VLGGVHVARLAAMQIIVALTLSILNSSVKPLLVLFALPAPILSLGLFLLVINTAMIELAAYLIPDRGFVVDSWWWAFFFSVLLSFLNSILERLISIPMRSQSNDNGVKIFDKDGNRWRNPNSIKLS